ncbi:MAG: hypothetical protein HGA51_06150 [Demequinaceae bacterium]|nr:hypothetical protein [Demequinaceae bacterium]
MVSRLVKLGVAALAALLAVVGLPSVASAEPTGNYVYTCVTPGQADWTIPKGSKLSLCTNAYIYVRINGALVEVVPTNASGVKVNGKVDPNKVDCVVAIVGGVASVATLSGAWGWIGLTASVYGMKSCVA